MRDRLVRPGNAVRAGQVATSRRRWCLAAAADRFFPKEVAQKQTTPVPSSLPEIVSDQISGDEA